MEALAPFVAIAGGLLIGSAAALFPPPTGRIAGASGLAAVASPGLMVGAWQPWALVGAMPAGMALHSFTFSRSTR